MRVQVVSKATAGPVCGVGVLLGTLNILGVCLGLLVRAGLASRLPREAF